MKQFYIFAALFLLIGGVFSVNAQDLIILKDGNTIEAKVTEISPTEIRYKRFDHLDGPTIVIMAANVLSIRYENGRTEIINDVTQPITTPHQLDRNPRFNTLGLTVGYLGVSKFGFSLKGTVSPVPYTFFDFNMGFGFESFSFNGNVNFNGFVPFRKGGWYGGLGLGGGVYEFADSMNGYFAVNAITGFLFFNHLNISAALEMEVVPEFHIRFKPMAGYVYRFKSQQDIDPNTGEAFVTQQKPKEKKPPRELVAHHWISVEPNFDISSLGSGISARYQYQITPRFAIGGSIHYLDPEFSFFGNDEYRYYELESFTGVNIGKEFSLVANGYWYPSSRIFFLKLGLGWYYRHIREYSDSYSNYDFYYDDDNYRRYYRNYSFKNTSNGLCIVPGFGWTIDIGKPGDFFISTGLELPITIGKYRSKGRSIHGYEKKLGGDSFVDEYVFNGREEGDRKYGIRVFFGIGYAF